jgi:hypothetical protein
VRHISFILLLLFANIISAANFKIMALPVEDELTVKITINNNINNIVTCERKESKVNIMLCSSEEYNGLLFHEKDSKNLIPFLYDKEKNFIVDLKIIFNEKYYRFSWSNFASFSLYNDKIRFFLSTSIFNGSLDFDDIKLLFSTNRQLRTSFKKYNNDIKDKKVKQKFNIFDNNKYSYLKIIKNNKTPKNKPIINNIITTNKKAVTLISAQEIFNNIQLREDIPFNYTNDGCYARAHVIAHELDKQNIKTGKIWLRGKIIDQNQPEEPWCYHVAALIFVDVSGSEEPRVIDPSPTVKKLVTVEEWFEILIGNEKVPFMLEYPMPAYISPFYDYAYCLSSHEPLWPHYCALIIDSEEYLKHAFETNKENLNKLNNNSNSCL